MKNCKTYSEQNLVTFNKKQIPQTLNYILIEVVAKQTSEPLKCNHTRVENLLFKMHTQLNQFFFQQLSDNHLVYSSTNHQLVVIVGQVISLNQLNKSPKSLFFRQYLQQSTHYEVKSLAIPNLRVPKCVSSTDFFYYLQGKFSLIASGGEEFLISEGPVHIQLDLVEAG